MRQIDGRDIYSITEVNYFAKQTLEQMIFWVEGEISTLKKHPTLSFYYLDLRDEKAILPAIANGYVVESLEEDLVGQRVIAFGNLTLYEPWGKYQFRISRIEKAGEGLLQRQLEELTKKLKAEGLFDQANKKEIPKYPKKVCIVTSSGSDAYNDFLKHTTRQFPIIELFAADVRVQGPRSIPNLLKVLPNVDKRGFDVIVITRGGGSAEDLAAFNDEQVARTIFKMKTPTIVAIGHETNESLAEWVADRRASTPTDAAHIVVAGYGSLLMTLDNFKYQLSTKSSYYFSTNFQRLDYIFLQLTQTKLTFKDLPSRLIAIEEMLKRHEKHLISDARERVNSTLEDIKKRSTDILKYQNQSLENLYKSLRLLSPENTLERGYSITTNQEGQVMRNIKEIVVGNVVGVKLKGGSLTSRVLTKKENEKTSSN